ncbi:hypothetical protein Peur_040538 [Populus x canadensis]
MVKSCLFRSHDEQLDITCQFSRNISINVKRKQEQLSSCLNKIGAIIASGANSIRRRSLNLPSKRTCIPRAGQFNGSIQLIPD